MNKSELIAAVAMRCGVDKTEVQGQVNAALELIAAALERGERVQLTGFGTFEVKHRKARVGRDARTKEETRIPPANVPVFKASKALRDRMEQEEEP